MLAVGAASQAPVADAPFDPALGLGRARRAGVDVKAQALGVAPVDRMRGAPGAGAGHDRRLLVVDAHGGRHTAEAHERGIMDPQPGQQIASLAPDQRPAPRERQLQHERQQGAPLSA